MSKIKKLTVTKEEERTQWVKILEAASNYHWDMSGQFEPELIGDVEMKSVARVHRGWARAIQEAIYLIKEWEFDEEDDIKRVDVN
tara:strand:- start:91 stop:345 length:255 start_codon:yes stop_codon:yes gene_type:complete